MQHAINLKMEAKCSSKTSADYQWTTWHYIPDERALHQPHNLLHGFET
jgi:hypothetical protein